MHTNKSLNIKLKIIFEFMLDLSNALFIGMVNHMFSGFI